MSDFHSLIETQSIRLLMYPSRINVIRRNLTWKNLVHHWSQGQNSPAKRGTLNTFSYKINRIKWCKRWWWNWLEDVYCVSAFQVWEKIKCTPCLNLGISFWNRFKDKISKMPLLVDRLSSEVRSKCSNEIRCLRWGHFILLKEGLSFQVVFSRSKSPVRTPELCCKHEVTHFNNNPFYLTSDN